MTRKTVTEIRDRIAEFQQVAETHRGNENQLGYFMAKASKVALEWVIK